MRSLEVIFCYVFDYLIELYFPLKNNYNIYYIAFSKNDYIRFYIATKHRQNINRLEMRLQSPANWILY